MEEDSSREAFEARFEHNNEDLEAASYLAMWHLHRHSYPKARTYLGHIVTLRRDDYAAWQSICICCLVAGEVEEGAHAYSELERLGEEPEKNVRTYFCLALLREKQRNWNAASQGYAKCIKLCEQQHAEHATAAENAAASGEVAAENVALATLVFIQNVKWECMLRQCFIKKECGNNKEFESVFATAKRLLEEKPNPYVTADAHCLLGMMHEAKGNSILAETSYSLAIQTVESHYLSLEHLGRLYLKYHDTLKNAVSCFCRAVQVNPCSSVSWYLLGRCYMAAGQHSDAHSAYERALNLQPNDPLIWCSLGVLYYAHGQLQEALANFSRAARLDPTMPEAQYNLGCVCIDLQDVDRADLHFDKASDLGLAKRCAKRGLILTRNVEAKTKKRKQGEEKATEQVEEQEAERGGIHQASDIVYL